MSAIFISSVLLLLILGIFRTRFQQATLHWGRAIAGLGRIRGDIEAAKTSGDIADAGELLGASIQQRGFQDAITPPQLTNLTIIYWPVCVGVYIWGFFALPWYIAIAWPIAFVAIKRVAASWLPDPGSDYYRQKIIANLVSRREGFRRSGDGIRVAATERMLMLLREE
jgi:hypothetical protein